MDHRAAGLTDAEAIRMYRTMLLARRLDERQWLLNRAGKLPFVISCQGHEAAQVGAGFALKPGIDFVLPYYRDLALVLALGVTSEAVMLAAFARADDPASGGRQMPNHFSDRRLRIFTQSSPTGTQIPHAVGFAWAARYTGEPFVAFVSFGDGTSNQGDFHEGLNFAGVFKLPVIAFVENNRYAISVPLERQIASPDVASRAQSYGMAGVKVDGRDPFAVYRVVREARERALAGEGGTLIEADVMRLTPHSSDDDDRTYRSREEVEALRQADPVARVRAYLLEQALLDAAALEALEAEVAAEVDRATAAAEAAPLPDPATAMRHVYAEAPERPGAPTDRWGGAGGKGPEGWTEPAPDGGGMDGGR
ncbi:MAG: thiamine pyrophosphate-dependent dehydrogenase E1 component subunit alpha [Hydrogenibacillus schlegelii]|nr:thiamine pyrophosphate-dependent dehydrogenase E1 component subunit alpha [Hydrogenibacillus schlegelii]